MAKNEELKKENIQAVRACFYQGGTWTKNSLAEAAGLSLAGTTNVLQELQEKNEIIHISDAASTGGRKSKQYVLNPEFCHVASIDCRHHGKQYSYELQLLNLHQEEIRKMSFVSEMGSLHDFQKALSVIKRDCKVKMIAVSIPGVCCQGKINACDFPQLAGVDLGKIITEKCGLPYVIENDVNTACVSYASHDPELKNIALLYQPAKDEIGCGIMIEGKLYNGIHHEAGEMKHLGNQKMSDQEKLKRSVLSLQAVMDPQQIIWCSETVAKLDDSFHNLVHLDNINTEIQNGLYQMCIHQLLRLRKDEE